ncbi:unnamed protein product [Symbiodinium microadriaticum]|nr:unnamed protein product [Symbiodinium microadriaticum]
MVELQSIYGLPNKEYQRNTKQARAEDLSAKQIAVAITNIASSVTSNDIMEIGGDAESLLTQNSNRFKKSKNKEGEAEAINQARAAGMRWKKRLGKNKLSKDDLNKKIETELMQLKQAEDEDPREPLKSMLAKVEDLLNSHERAAVKDERARAEALEKKEKLLELKSRQIATKERRLSDWEADLQAREQALIILEGFMESLAQQRALAAMAYNMHVCGMGTATQPTMSPPLPGPSMLPNAMNPAASMPPMAGMGPSPMASMGPSPMASMGPSPMASMGPSPTVPGMQPNVVPGMQPNVVPSMQPNVVPSMQSPQPMTSPAFLVAQADALLRMASQTAVNPVPMQGVRSPADLPPQAAEVPGPMAKQQPPSPPWSRVSTPVKEGGKEEPPLPPPDKPPPASVDLTEEDPSKEEKSKEGQMSPKAKARPIKIHKIAMFPIDWGKSALEIFARVVPLIPADTVPADSASVPADASAVATDTPLPKETVNRAEVSGAGSSKDKPKGKEKKKRKTTSSEDDDNKDKGEKGRDNDKAGGKTETTLEAKWFKDKSSRELEKEASNDIRNLVVSQPAENLTTPDAKVAPGSEAKSSAPADEKLAKKKRKAAEAAEPLSSVKPRRLGFGSVQKERHDALMDDGLGDSSSENPGEEDEEEEEPACAANPAKALEDVGDEDADLFKDKYALAIPQASACKKTESMPAIMDAPAAASCGGSWDKLPLGIRSKLEKVHSDLIDFLPTALSQCLAGSDEHVMAFVLEFPVMSSAGVAAFLMLRSDFPHFLDILVSEDILNLSDALELVSELGGNWLDCLGEKSKAIQAKLTLKGKKILSKWPEELQAAQQDADISEAHEAEWMDTWLARKIRELAENTTVVNQLTRAWLVDLRTHIVRPTDYKGRLLVSGHEVNLEAWAATMDFLGVTQRWQKTKLFSPATQLASDFLYRHSHNPATHKCNIYGQDLSHQRFRSLELIVDASPKGKLDVWSPIGYAGRVAAALPLQRLSALAVSTVSVQTKMEEGQKIVDKFAETAAEGKQAKVKKMHLGSIKIRPKAISKIRQKKLSAREQMRACMHVLSVLDLELLVGTVVLRPLDPARGEKRMVEDGKAWLWDPATGEASWDCLTPRHQSHLRLVLAPDEGSTLWAAFTFLASQNFKVNFVRDELHKLQNHYLRLFQCNKAVKRTWALSEWLMKAKRGPWAHSEDLLQELFASSILEENGWDANAEGIHAFENVCEILEKASRRVASSYKAGRWCSWGFCAAGFRKYYSATLLVVLWGCLEEGVNPFADMGVAATGNDGQKYNRIMDCCIRALIDEEAHKLFESVQFFTEPWCEMCLWLATGLHM